MRIHNVDLRRKIVILVQEIAGDDGNRGSASASCSLDATGKWKMSGLKASTQSKRNGDNRPMLSFASGTAGPPGATPSAGADGGHDEHRYHLVHDLPNIRELIARSRFAGPLRYNLLTLLTQTCSAREPVTRGTCCQAGALSNGTSLLATNVAEGLVFVGEPQEAPSPFGLLTGGVRVSDICTGTTLSMFCWDQSPRPNSA
jgi:hypothetical protein